MFLSYTVRFSEAAIRSCAAPRKRGRRRTFGGCSPGEYCRYNSLRFLRKLPRVYIHSESAAAPAMQAPCFFLMSEAAIRSCASPRKRGRRRLSAAVSTVYYTGWSAVMGGGSSDICVISTSLGRSRGEDGYKWLQRWFPPTSAKNLRSADAAKIGK